MGRVARFFAVCCVAGVSHAADHARIVALDGHVRSVPIVGVKEGDGGVVCVTYGDGSRVWVNHTAEPKCVDGVCVPAKDAILKKADAPQLQVVAADALVWLYADSRAKDVPSLQALDVPSNGVADVNLLLDGLVPGEPVEVSLSGAEGGEWFRLGAVPVRRNTGIGGFLEHSGRVNPYVARRAPFDVFDVLEPLPARRIASPRSVEAFRLRLPCAALGPGEHRLALGVRQGGKALTREVKLRVHAAALPDVGCASFKYTNWMSIGNMAERHGLKLWSEAHWQMVERYLRCMAAARQNLFLVPREALFERDGDGRLAFAKARFERLLRLCDRAGIWYLEGPHLAGFTNGWGSPNFHPHFSTNLTTSVAGTAELRHLAGIVRQAVETYGLRDRWYQHVADEPSSHNAGEYIKTADIVRSCLPGVRITDAVEQPGFESVVDVPCPKVDMYERRRADFAIAREKPWCYTCCVPGGKWMNRLMDGELLKPALLPWVCTISGVDGFLHWGGNHYQKGQDPFKEPYPTSWKGANGGNTLPPGDTHVVYPGANGPWPSVRLEATRAGLEDADLLLQLRAADPTRADALVRRIARGFCDYSPDVLLYRQLRRELLDALDDVRAGRVLIRPTEADATETIQAALDRVWRTGGGRVSIAAGSYAVGGLRLRSNTELHLEAGAVLNASRNCARFAILAGDRLEPVPEGLRSLPGSRGVSAKRLAPWCDGILRIFCATNVAVTGEPGSAIDGHNSYSPTGEERYRGVHGICADFSTNVVVRGVELRNTGNWATRFFDCADLRFEDLRLRGGHDGVHVRGCDRVRVTRCDIRTGDDAIAGFDNTDVSVTDCALNTSCSAFRFGGTHVRVSKCRIWGPGEWPFRGSLSAADKAAGVSSQGHGRANLLSFWTYFADFSRSVRNPPGDIVVSDCTVGNADRFLHYNFSGNETWQKGAPLGDIRFERVKATRLGASLCAYGDAARPLALTLVGCDLAFREPQTEFVRGAHVGSVELKDVRIERVDGPCVRTWAGAPELKFSDVKGLEPKVEKADKPFSTRAI